MYLLCLLVCYSFRFSKNLIDVIVVVEMSCSSCRTAIMGEYLTKEGKIYCRNCSASMHQLGGLQVLLLCVFVYVYVCVYECMCVCVYVCLYMYMCICMRL